MLHAVIVDNFQMLSPPQTPYRRFSCHLSWVNDILIAQFYFLHIISSSIKTMENPWKLCVITMTKCDNCMAYLHFEINNITEISSFHYICYSHTHSLLHMNSVTINRMHWLGECVSFACNHNIFIENVIISIYLYDGKKKREHNTRNGNSTDLRAVDRFDCKNVNGN